MSILETIRRTDSPTIANVLEVLGIRSRAAGFANGSLKAIYPEHPPAVGYAVTATFRSAYPGESGTAYSGTPEIISFGQSVEGPKIVVFEDLDDPPAAATYGELMATAFKAFGYEGLITSGAARDLEQVRPLGFPCWASSVIVSHGYCRVEEIGVPVTVGGLRIRTGDLLHADCNGIVSIPKAHAELVAELCGPFAEAERIVLRSLQGPAPTLEGYRAAVEEMKAELGRLAERAKLRLADGG